MNKAREKILEKLKNAPSSEIPEEADFLTPIYFPLEGNLGEVFKKNAELVSASVSLFDTEVKLFSALKQKIDVANLKVVSCHEPTIQEKLTSYNINFNPGPDLPKDMEAGITGCEYLVAHTGSAMVSSAQRGGRRMFVYPPIHIIIAYENQFVDYLETAYKRILGKYGNDLPSLITIITGPSRTADIEKTLVLGAHGPKELHILISKK
jgi:L-lactate dehydrogenase complex protein LldG